jgi:hypothetical protein
MPTEPESHCSGRLLVAHFRKTSLVDFERYHSTVGGDGIVTGRYKYIRPSFLTAVFSAEGHWLNRPIVPDLLREGVDLFDVG